MTRLPLENRGVVSVEGDPYELNQRCAVVGCTERGNERHHLWRRSFLVGDYWWVKLPDGRVIGNCVGLCQKHHADVTTNRAEIRYLDGIFKWVPPTGDISTLAWQPPIVQPPDSVLEEAAISLGIGPLVGAGETVYEGHPLAEVEGLHDHEHVPECPTCHQRIKPPKSPSPPEEKKNRRTWSIAVPKERQEDGADVLDTLIDEARKELDAVGISYGDEHKYKYHVLATAMALFVAHGREVMANG